ncbi:MAG: M16 family metallopeptidase [Pyrinomonadaceae bacterium]
MKILKCIAFSIVLLTVASAWAQNKPLRIEYEKFTLPNGLDVIFHVDRSDPVVAVSLTAHVGSAREKPGRTGFAHLFEHLFFLESENLGKGGLDKMTARIGGSGANGSTNNDRTNFLQTVPNDALEKMLWAEADKLGWFINTITEPVLAKEKQVVKNEKRQSVDNAPYGHTGYVIDKAACAADHPYNWQVIGSLEDLQNATLDDVKEFYRRWYGPQNVTLVVAGDFDTAQAKKWVEKYFSEIKRGPETPRIEKRPCVITRNFKLYHEDNFAREPDLTYAWSTVPQYHPDSYALSVLANYLTRGKKAPFYKVLVEDKKLTAGVSMFNGAQELAGQMQLNVTAFADKDLDEVAAAIDEAFAKFEKEGISEKDLARIKAGQETQFYNGLSSVLGKGTQLAQGNLFAGDPGQVEKDIKSIMAITPADVTRVYEKYIKGKNRVATSFVPKGKLDLALQGSEKAEVVEEKIVAGAEAEVDPNVKATYAKTPSTFDRSVEPPYGPAPQVKVPSIWETKTSNGMRVFGIENNEVPLVNFEIVIDGGEQLDDINKVGVAYLTARMMTQGTAKKTPQELEEAIQQLGANINVFAGTEAVTIQGNTLAKNYDATMALVEEILLEPRWDAKEFDLLKKGTISTIRQQEGNPNAVAENQYRKLIYGDENIRSRTIFGTIDTVNSITLDDVKAYYARALSPSVARMHVVGALDQNKVVNSLKGLNARWTPRSIEIPVYKTPAPPSKAAIYFYDIPDAKQSVVRFGYPALAATDKDYYPAAVMNYILGGGGFASRLTQQLREGKGYTYGINSSFFGTHSPGPFTVGSSVRTNVTLEAAQLIKSILDDFGKTYTEEDLATTKSFMIKSNARAFETANAKLGMLGNISQYGWKPDYVREREQIVKNMTVDEIKRLAAKYLNTNRMVFLVVGDAKTQMPRLRSLGLGEPVLLNKSETVEN